MTWLTQLINHLFCWLPRIWLVRPDESGVRITLGSRIKPSPPGWYLYWPLIQECIKLTVTVQVVDIRPQAVMTLNKESLCCGAAIRYRIKDAVAAILRVQDFDQSLQALSMGIISKYFAKKADNDYNNLEECVLKGIKEAARGWGLDILAVYITDIGASQNIRLLMDKSGIGIVRNDEVV